MATRKKMTADLHNVHARLLTIFAVLATLLVGQPGFTDEAKSEEAPTKRKILLVRPHLASDNEEGLKIQSSLTHQLQVQLQSLQGRLDLVPNANSDLISEKLNEGAESLLKENQADGVVWGAVIQRAPNPKSHIIFLFHTVREETSSQDLTKLADLTDGFLRTDLPFESNLFIFEPFEIGAIEDFEKPAAKHDLLAINGTLAYYAGDYALASQMLFKARQLWNVSTSDPTGLATLAFLEATARLRLLNTEKLTRESAAPILNILELAIRLQPFQPQFRYFRAFIHRELGDSAAALRDLEAVLKYEKQDTHASDLIKKLGIDSN